MARKFLLVMSFIFVASCDAYDTECVETGFLKEPVCDFSMYEVIGNGHHFDGRVMRIRGYLSVHTDGSGKERSLIFASEEAERLSDYAAAIEIGSVSKDVDSERRGIYLDQLKWSNRQVFAI